MKKEKKEVVIKKLTGIIEFSVKLPINNFEDLGEYFNTISEALEKIREIGEAYIVNFELK